MMVDQVSRAKRTSPPLPALNETTAGTDNDTRTSLVSDSIASLRSCELR